MWWLKQRSLIMYFSLLFLARFNYVTLRKFNVCSEIEFLIFKMISIPSATADSSISLPEQEQDRARSITLVNAGTSSHRTQPIKVVSSGYSLPSPSPGLLTRFGFDTRTTGAVPRYGQLARIRPGEQGMLSCRSLLEVTLHWAGSHLKARIWVCMIEQAMRGAQEVVGLKFP